MNGTPHRILLVTNPGGHLLQMLALEGAWAGLERRWVTLAAADSNSLLAEEDVVYANGPTARNLINLMRNFGVAWQTVRHFDPDVILSTGAALAIPVLRHRPTSPQAARLCRELHTRHPTLTQRSHRLSTG